MKTLAIWVGAIILLIIGGGLTVQMRSADDDAKVLPFLVQVDQPEASVFEATPQQAQHFVVYAIFAIVNLVGIGATIAVVLWLLHRGVLRSRAEAEQVANSQKS